MRNYEMIEYVVAKVAEGLYEANGHLRWMERLVNESLWVSVNDETPPANKEVIALSDKGEISFAHIVFGKDVQSYDGWNIPDVAFWMPFQMSDEMKEFYKND